MSGMVCTFDACRKPITRAELGKRAEVHRVGGKLLVYGEGMPDGNLKEATGPLVETLHGKCYHARHHREQLASGSIAWRQVLAEARSDDPSPRRDASDWREQEEHDVEALVEGDGDHRAPGARGV